MRTLTAFIAAAFLVTFVGFTSAQEVKPPIKVLIITGDEWDKQFEKIIAGGWRKQGYHGKRHEYSVTITVAGKDHPITKGLPHTFPHNNDELYQNSVIPEGAIVLATAYSDPKKDPKN